jgi:UDP-N-acetylglucosamine 3-dehydrogenase
VTWPGWGSDIDAGLIADFLKLAAGQDAPTLATGEDGLRALQVALAAYRSAEAAAPIAV